MRFVTRSVLAIALGAVSVTATAAESPFAYFLGNWSCEGYFVRSKKPIAADIGFAIDGTDSLVRKRHADRAPNTYKAEEIWNVSPSGTSLRAAVVDGSGMRWYESRGWEGDRFAWRRVAGEGEPNEEFVYLRKTDATMVYEWWIDRGQGKLEMGDTLTCSRSERPGAAPGRDVK